MYTMFSLHAQLCVAAPNISRAIVELGDGLAILSAPILFNATQDNLLMSCFCKALDFQIDIGVW